MTVRHHVMNWLDENHIDWKAELTNRLGARFEVVAGGTVWTARRQFRQMTAIPMLMLLFGMRIEGHSSRFVIQSHDAVVAEPMPKY